MAQGRSIVITQGKGKFLPFKKEIFRSSVMITVFCFLDETMKTCKEIHRALSDDGILYIAFIERDGEIFHRYKNRSEKSRFLSLARFYSREGVATFFLIQDFYQSRLFVLRGFVSSH